MRKDADLMKKLLIAAVVGILLGIGLSGTFPSESAQLPCIFQEEEREENDLMKALVVIVVGAVVGIGLLSAIAVEGAEYERGEALFHERCQTCHGIKGDGKGPTAASLTPKPANFTNPRFWRENNEKKIATTIKKGRGPMPAFDLKPDEVKAIIDYMSHAFKKVGK